MHTHIQHTYPLEGSYIHTIVRIKHLLESTCYTRQNAETIFNALKCLKLEVWNYLQEKYLSNVIFHVNTEEWDTSLQRWTKWERKPSKGIISYDHCMHQSSWTYRVLWTHGKLLSQLQKCQVCVHMLFLLSSYLGRIFLNMYISLATSAEETL